MCLYKFNFSHNCATEAYHFNKPWSFQNKVIDSIYLIRSYVMNFNGKFSIPFKKSDSTKHPIFYLFLFKTALSEFPFSPSAAILYKLFFLPYEQQKMNTNKWNLGLELCQWLQLLTKILVRIQVLDLITVVVLWVSNPSCSPQLHDLSCPAMDKGSD